MQKKAGLFISFLLIFSIAVSAQFKAGMRMAGANVASVVFNSGSSDINVTQIGSNKSKITSYNVNIRPSLGFFLSDHTAVGAELNINPYGNTTSYEQGGTTYQSDKYNNFNIGIGGFVRHYFGKSGSMIPFAQLGINGGISTIKTEGFFYGGTGANAYKLTYEGSSNSGFFINSTFQAGITKMVSELTGLDFFIGYNFSSNNNTFNKTTLRDDGNNGTIDSRGENETTTKFTNHGFMLGVGFQVFLRSK